MPETDNPRAEWPTEVDVSWLHERLESGGAVFMLDVREPWELEMALIRGSFSIPMAEVPSRIGVLPKDDPIVVICRVGGRSAQVAAWLRSQGFENSINLVGGTNAWAQHIDPEMSVY